MKTSDFDYELPSQRIAQTPIEPRHSSRLLVLDRKSPELIHTTFWNITDFLNPGDLLVINQTRVIPARLFARKSTGGKVEVLLLHKIDDFTWEVLVGGKRMTSGKHLKIENGPEATITEQLEGARRRIRFDEPIEAYLPKAGQMPLPPYIHTRLEDQERYQTVYSSITGSAAAPTAGLHFTHELMQRVEDMGVRFANVTLHVGLDTFAPVTEEDAEQHHIHTEWCQLTRETAEIINNTKHTGGRIIAVGTTSVRTLETAAKHADPGQLIGPFTGNTDLFILPGYKFGVVEAMVTNFHLPHSTLIMLVSAFAGRERILNTYRTAVEQNYRFYSFGDAMLIL